MRVQSPSGKVDRKINILMALAGAVVFLAWSPCAVGQVPTTTVQICTAGQCTSVAVPDLSGTYTADDGAVYYVQQSGSAVWWVGMSLDSQLSADKQWHRGLQFTHLFQGTFTSATAVNGHWADVTRGSNLSFGILSFSVDTSSGSPQLTRTAYSGNIIATTWTQTSPLDDTLWDGNALDIITRFDAVHKNNASCLVDGDICNGYETIDDNLKAYRDSSVFYGHVATLATDSSGNTKTTLPVVNYPNWGIQDRDFLTFLCENGSGDGGKDGDLDITLTIDLTKLEPDFYTAGWGNRDLGPTIMGIKLNSAFAHSVLGLDANSAFLHIEALQYGRAGTCDSPQDPTYDYYSLLPGWSEASSNSLLVNGRPVNGYMQRSSLLNDCDFFEPCPFPSDDNAVIIGDAGNGQYNQIWPDSYLRVAGALVLDCGHGLGSPCYDELPDPSDPLYELDYLAVAANQNQEIHPIYSLDVINYPFRPEDANVVNRLNLTGTWAGSEGSTYYVRQIGNTIWMLGETRDRQPMQRGSDFPQIGDLALTPQFQAGDPPCYTSPYLCWGFARVFVGTIAEQVQGGAAITGEWAGAPQSSSLGSTGGSMVFYADYTRKNLVPVASGVFPVLLQKMYEPEDTTPPQSYISFDGPQYSFNSQSFVNSGTQIRITASDNDSGVQNLWYRQFPQGTTAPLYTPVIASSIGFSLSGADGPYEVDSYATDNAGNDESAQTTTVYLDNTPPQAAIIQPAATTYPHSSVLQLTYSVSDGTGSGVKSFTPTMDGAVQLPDGTGLASGQNINLLTEMALGTHTFNISSLDNLGNAGMNSVTFSIIVTPASLSSDVTQFLAAGKITVDNGNSLLHLLAAAGRARAAGDCKTADNEYRAFISEVTALSGKKIDPAAAQIMIGDVGYLIAHCP